MRIRRGGGVEVQAQRVMDRMASAYQNMVGYAAVSDVEVSGAEKPVRFRSAVWLQKPGRCRIRLEEGSPGVERAGGRKPEARTWDEGATAPARELLAEDGTLYQLLDAAGMRYRKQTVGPPRAGLSAAFEQSGLLRYSLASAFLLDGGSAVSRLVTGAFSVHVTGTAIVEGEPVDVVTARPDLGPNRPRNPEPTAAPQMVFYISQTDHLLRRCVRTLTRNGKTVVFTETWSRVRVNEPFPEATFRFVPPPGAVGETVGTAGAFAGTRTRQTPATIAAAPLGDASPAKPSGLSVLPGDGVTLVSASQARCDFGAVSLLDQDHAEAQFTLKNSGPTPVTLARIGVTCGCLSAAPLPRKPGELAPTFPITLAPGEEQPLRMAVDFMKIAPGPVASKFTLVWVAGVEAPVLRLEMKGELKPAARFSQKALDLGAVRPAEGKQVRISMALDPRVCPSDGGSQPALVSTNRAVSVTPVTGSRRVGPTGVRGEEKWVHQDYLVQVKPDAPFGSVSTSLTFLSTSPAQPATPAAAAARRALAFATLPVSAEVQGDTEANPKAVSLGVVAQGTEKTVVISLKGNPDAVSGDVAFASGTPWLSVHLGSVVSVRAAVGQKPGATVPRKGVQPAVLTREIRLTLSGDAPAGQLETEVLLVLPDKRRVIIPVSVLIEAPQGKAP